MFPLGWSCSAVFSHSILRSHFRMVFDASISPEGSVSLLIKPDLKDRTITADLWVTGQISLGCSAAIQEPTL